MWINNLNPVLLQLGPLQVRWYGLAYVLGFFVAVWWLQYLSKKGTLSLDKEEVWDLVFYLMIGILIGARLFEIFWQPAYYLSSFWNIFKIWQGGMSFHGGFVGIVVAAWFYCKKKQLPFWKIADALSIPTIFALALGRVANFINGDLAGRVFDGKWCVVFPQYDDLCRHPSTLYAAGKRVIVFGWLLYLALQEKFKPGFIFWNFVFWEGLGRIIVDYFRHDSLFLNFSLGQWFSLAMVLVALWMFSNHYTTDWKRLLKSTPEE